MLRTLLIVAGLLATAAAGVVAYAAATQPDDFRIERTAVINAPADKIYPLIADFKAWDAWSPWEKKDPNMKRTFSEPSAGKGATYAWEGNSEVGSGEMVMAEATSPSKVDLDMHFKTPFEARHKAEFALTPEGNATKVTWAMSGQSSLMAKVMCTFMDMDKMVGGEFEKGLSAMKAKAEG